MSAIPVFTSLKLEKVKSVHVSADFDVYENYYFATDLETLASNISEEVNKVLRLGFGLLNDEFQVSEAVLNGKYSTPGVCIRLNFYRPRHFETFCKIGQEHSKFHEEYFILCNDYLSGNISSIQFIDSLKHHEKEIANPMKLCFQEFVLYTSPQSYDESIPIFSYKEKTGTHPYVKMYQQARIEASEHFDDDVHFVNFSLYQPVIAGTIYRSSTNNFTVCLGMYRLKPLSVDEALTFYSFDKPEYVKKSEDFYKQFSKLSILYLTSELSSDEFYTKLITLEKEAA